MPEEAIFILNRHRWYSRLWLGGVPIKKINLIIMISMVFVITGVAGCKQKQFHGWPPPIKGLHWGMKEEETIKAMDLKAKSFTRTEEDTIVLVHTKKEYDIYGAKITPSLSFYNGHLITIFAEVKEDDVEMVDERLTEELGEGDYRYSLNSESLDKYVVSAYRCDIRTKEDPQLYELIKRVYLDADFDLLKQILSLKDSLGDLPLTVCEFNLDMNSKGFGHLIIDGKTAAMLNYPKMLNKKDQ